jgi:hypothetical protein
MDDSWNWSIRLMIFYGKNMTQSNPCPWMKLILINYPQWLDEFKLYALRANEWHEFLMDVQYIN